MGTQAVVSQVVEGQVRLKAVCGFNGQVAQALAWWLADNPSATAAQTFAQARKLSFGGEDDLVVLDADHAIYEGDDDLSPLYRSSFGDSSFNPRWECGAADYIFVVAFGEPGYPPGKASVSSHQVFEPSSSRTVAPLDLDSLGSLDIVESFSKKQ